MKFLIITFCMLLIVGSSAAYDSLQVLSLNSFLQIVKKYHPVAKQAQIQVSKARAELTMAKGGFDPLFETDLGNKTFDGINYYQNNALQLNIPTWYGIEIQGGIEYLAGGRTDPQETVGKTSFAGISIPLAKNLLMDKRRATLKQAKIMIDASDQEKKIMLNDLLREATEAYWQWVLAYINYKNYDNIIAVNKRRTGMVTAAFRNGEKAAIDTTEATAQLQSYEYLQNDALLDWQNATVMLNNFLWKENNEGYELTMGEVSPEKKLDELFDNVIFPELETLVADAKATHPELMMYNYKLDVLAVDKKLKFQDLLPKLDVKYNQLGKGYDIASTATKTLFDNNYRYGVSFSMPLRISQGRGAYKLAKLNIVETKLAFNQKETVIVNKIKNYYNQLVNYKLQISLLQKTYNNYLLLQRGEETRFFNGESSLFLVNSRENKALETLLNLTEATINYNKTAYTLQWSAGDLWNF